MPTFGDLLPDNLKNASIARHVVEGLVFKYPFNGTTYKKYNVILGFTGDQLMIATVFINTEKRSFSPKKKDIEKHQLIATKVKNPFLDYDSFVSCSSIFEHKVDEVIEYLTDNSSDILGNLDSHLLTECQYTISQSRIHSPKVKKKYGLF